MVIDGDFSCGVDIEKGGSSHVHPDFRVSENEKKTRPRWRFVDPETCNFLRYNVYIMM
jgi:hypothetical protein